MENYHFIGIGGIGMSALARILKQKGKRVQGSDLAATYVTESLEKEGIEVFLSHSAEHVKERAHIVYSTAIAPHHPELKKAREEGLPLLHRSDLLSLLLQEKETVAVAGSHGKTTTTALLAHVLVKCGKDPSFAVGGMVNSLGTNGAHGTGDYFVVESDESDGSFLKMHPLGAILTNIDNDHLDYWKTQETLIQGFKTFSTQVTSPELFFFCLDDPRIRELNLTGKSYGFSKDAFVRIIQWRQEGWRLIFDLQIGQQRYKEIALPLVGKHNVLNGAAVFALALSLGLGEQELREAFLSFQGIKRRMEKKGEKKGVLFLDDYGHHPTEIRATLKALRQAAGERRVVVAFQPHRYTRTRDCWDDFLTAFEEADVVCFTDIYAASETPLPGITGEALYTAFAQQTKVTHHFLKKEVLAEQLASLLRPYDIVLTLGAGDITNLSKAVLEKEIPSFKLAVLSGGKSSEHEVSLRSTQGILRGMNPLYYTPYFFTLTKTGKWCYEDQEIALSKAVDLLQTCDVGFPMLHGPYGEDGMIQGFLETLALPYVGCDYRACALTMDKAWTKRVVQTYGIAVAPFEEMDIYMWKEKREECLATVEKNLRFPLFAKPVHLGSTFGVFRVETKRELEEAVDKIFKLDYKLVVEEEICGREIEFGLLGNQAVFVSDPSEIKKAAQIHTYEGKYGANANPTVCKIKLPEAVFQEGKESALKVYQACGCQGLARIDFFLTKEEKWILNEVNPMPGCTSTSAFPQIWEAEGVTPAELFDRLILSAGHRFRLQQRLLTP